MLVFSKINNQVMASPRTGLRFFVCFCVLMQIGVLVSSQGVLLPKRLVSRIGRKVHLPKFSTHQIDEAFSLAKDMVVLKRKHENELVREGKR